MTVSSEPHDESTSGIEAKSRWDGARRGPHKLFKLAALVVIVAGIVFIFAVVFWTGLMIGAHGGGHEGRHGGHDGKNWRQSEMTQQGPATTSAPTTSTATSPARP